MSRPQRKQLFVDPKVQGSFLLRIVAYWFLCTVVSGAVLLCWMMLTVPAFRLRLPLAEFCAQFAPAFMASAIMLPILLLDCLKLTNRMAGALYRVRREMRSLANGDPSHTVKFRDGDFWPGFADEFNAVRLRLMQLEDRLKALTLESPSTTPSKSVALKPVAGDRQTAEEQILSDVHAVGRDTLVWVDLPTDCLSAANAASGPVESVTATKDRNDCRDD